jgi:hypothetical protein
VKRFIAVLVISAVTLLGGASMASADPSFGPGGSDGEGNNGPHETPGTRCHPPGQTADSPECK